MFGSLMFVNDTLIQIDCSKCFIPISSKLYFLVLSLLNFDLPYLIKLGQSGFVNSNGGDDAVEGVSHTYQ